MVRTSGSSSTTSTVTCFDAGNLSGVGSGAFQHAPGVKAFDLLFRGQPDRDRIVKVDSPDAFGCLFYQCPVSLLTRARIPRCRL
jgi:hypothetical protein